MSRFAGEDQFDIIYSVSVIEHMPAEIRRAVIARLALLLVPQGQLLLSLDLHPGTELLWNFNEGKVVDKSDHGTLADIKDELATVGLEVATQEALCAMPLSRTDVAYLVCRKTAASEIKSAGFVR